MSEVITQDALRGLVGECLGQDKVVAGPALVKEGLCSYTRLSQPDELMLEGFIHPSNSIKEFFFPRHEPICVYRFKGQDLEIEDVDPPATEQVIFCARPCDAAAMPILDHVFMEQVAKIPSGRRTLRDGPP